MAKVGHTVALPVEAPLDLHPQHGVMHCPDPDHLSKTWRDSA